MVDLSIYRQQTSSKGIGLEQASTPKIIDQYKAITEAVAGITDVAMTYNKQAQEKEALLQAQKKDQRNLQLQKDAIDFSAQTKIDETDLRDQLQGNVSDYALRYKDFYQKKQNEFLKNYSDNEERETLQKILLRDYESGLNQAVRYQVTQGALQAKNNLKSIQDTLLQGVTENPQSIEQASQLYSESVDGMQSTTPQQKKSLKDEFVKNAQDNSQKARNVLFDNMAQDGDIYGMANFLNNPINTQNLDRSQQLQYQQKYEKAVQKKSDLFLNDPATAIKQDKDLANKPYDITAIRETVELQNHVDPHRAKVMPKQDRMMTVQALAGTDRLDDFDAQLDAIQEQYQEYTPNAIQDIIAESKNKKVNPHLMTLMGMTRDIDDAEERRAMFTVVKSGDQEIINLAKARMGSSATIQDYQIKFNDEFSETLEIMMKEGKDPTDLNQIRNSMYLMGLQKYSETGDIPSSIEFSTQYINKHFDLLRFDDIPIRIPKNQGYDLNKIEDGLDDLQENMLDDSLNKGVLYIGNGSQKIQQINNRTQIENAYWRLSDDESGVNLVNASGLYIYSEEDKKPIYVSFDKLSDTGKTIKEQKQKYFTRESMRYTIEKIPPDRRNQFLKSIGQDPETYLKSIGLPYQKDQ